NGLTSLFTHSEIGHQSMAPNGALRPGKVVIFGFCANMVGKVVGWIDGVLSIWLVISACATCCSATAGSHMVRRICGIGASLASAAHQVGRRSNTFCSSEAAVTFHGPVVTGQPLARSKCLKVVQSCPSKMCFGTM